MNFPWFHAVADGLTFPLLLVSPGGQVVARNPAARHAVSDIEPDCQLSLVAREASRFSRYLQLASRCANSLPGTLQLQSGTRWRCDAAATRMSGRVFVVLQLRRPTQAGERFTALNRQLEQLHAEVRRREQLEVAQARLLEDERASRLQIEALSRSKDELLAVVSHELRTPLQAISGWIALIKDNPEDQSRLLRGIEVIERNLAAEKQLTEDLIDTSMIVSGRMKLSLGPVNLCRAVKDALDTLAPAIQSKRVRVGFVTEADDIVVNGDAERLLQVFWNILANAVRHVSKDGKVQIQIRRVDSQVEVTVSDDGEGIEAELLPYIFDRFKRKDSSSTRRHAGLGLGLAITRHLAELHGGLVMAHSDGPGCGSTFTVNLPLPIFSQPRAASTAAIADDDDVVLKDLRVLLVEDHDDSRELLVAILETRGAEVIATSRSDEALKRFGKDERYDIVLSDIEMPEEDGITFIRKLRDLERQRELTPLPAVGVTARNIGWARVNALRSGYHTFLAKPVDPNELVATVASLCQRHTPV